MAWTTVTHSCGHQDRHQLYGRGKDRDWRAARLAEEPCDACRRAEFEAKNADAAAANAAAGLPPLTGSEKQILWAESIRLLKIDQAHRAMIGALSTLELQMLFGDEVDPEDPAIGIVVDALRAVTSARWWIDRRDLKVSYLLAELAQDLTPPPAPTPTPEIAADALAEATLRPATERTPIPVELRILGERIEARLPEKREDFRELVKALRYTWNGEAWARTITARSGPIDDRLVELGNRLLSAGFLVRVHDAELRRRIVAAEFAPERTRWITLWTSGEHAGKLSIQWARDDDLYSAAKALPGARYTKPCVTVPVGAFDAVEDFAEAYDVAISDKAREALGAARAAHDAAVLATPAKAPKRAKRAETKPPVDDVIDPDLRDDAASEWAMLHGDSAS